MTLSAPPAFREDVHKALQLWTKDSVQESPLETLLLVRREQGLSRANSRRATNQVLLAALQELAVEHPDQAALLRERFVEGRPVADVAQARSVAEVTVYKLQHRALTLLADTLYAQEQRARSGRSLAVAARLPPPTYDRLFGFDPHIDRLGQVLESPDAPWLVAIEGIGGIGKTALAHALVHRLAAGALHFVDFGWISAKQETLLADGRIKALEQPALTSTAFLDTLASQLLPAGAVGSGRAAGQVERELHRRLHDAGYLVVVDNLETVADLDELLPTLARLSGPTKFLLTSRESQRSHSGIYHYAVPELAREESLALIRHEAATRNLAHVLAAADEDLLPLFETAGGNPLALRLLAGQLQLYAVTELVDSLREARGKKAEDLYRYIYWRAWRQLPLAAQSTLVLMPLFAGTGADFAALRRVSDLPDDDLAAALEQLVRLSLVNVAGDVHARRFSIHRLTETFLLREVVKWQDGPGVDA